MDELQRYILNDIIGHIDKNLQIRNITIEDALKLKRYLQKLCDYLSKHHKELEGMRDMTDESFMTDIDIICKEHEEAMAQKDSEHAKVIAQKDSEIAMLKKQLEELQNNN